MDVFFAVVAGEKALVAAAGNHAGIAEFNCDYRIAAPGIFNSDGPGAAIWFAAEDLNVSAEIEKGRADAGFP